MNRNEYLKELQTYIQALPVEEQKEAMDYYYNYFEDADNDEKVIAELGSPAKLAEEIKAKFACVPATKEKKAENQEESNQYAENRIKGDPTALRFTFDASKVKNLDFAFGIAEIVMIAGDTYKVETRSIDPNVFRCELSERGTLVVQNTHKLPSFKFLGHENPSHKHPRILITIPKNAELEIVRISVGAGSFTSKDSSFSCKTGKLEVSAGKLSISNMKGGQIDFRCGAGNLCFSGTTNDSCNVDCGVGAVELLISGNPEKYSADAKIGLGKFRFNNQRKDGIGDVSCIDRKENHFSVNCGLGKVSIIVQ